MLASNQIHSIPQTKPVVGLFPNAHLMIQSHLEGSNPDPTLITCSSWSWSFIRVLQCASNTVFPATLNTSSRTTTGSDHGSSHSQSSPSPGPSYPYLPPTTLLTPDSTPLMPASWLQHPRGPCEGPGATEHPAPPNTAESAAIGPYPNPESNPTRTALTSAQCSVLVVLMCCFYDPFKLM